MVTTIVPDALRQKYPHLHDLALPFVEASDAERIDYLRSTARDGIWINYPEGDRIVDELVRLFYAKKSHRPECRCLISNTNNGKSMILGRLRKLVNGGPVRHENGVIMPLVTVLAPGAPSQGGIYDQILDAMDAPYNPRSNAVDKGIAVRKQLRMAGTRMVMIDEFEQVACGDRMNRERCLHAVKNLSTDLRIPFVVAGGMDAVVPIQSIPAVENRFIPILLKRWQDDGQFIEFRNFLDDFSAILPLKKPSRLGSIPVAKEVMTRCNGVMGEVNELLREATIQAIRNGREEVDLEIIQQTNYSGPLKRRSSLIGFKAKEEIFAR